MTDQKPTLEYGRAVRRRLGPRVATALSIGIGLAVTATSVCCVVAIERYDDQARSLVSRLAFGEDLILFLPPLAFVGTLAGTIGWKNNQSMAAVIGIVLCVIALVASLVGVAIDCVLHFYKT